MKLATLIPSILLLLINLLLNIHICRKAKKATQVKPESDQISELEAEIVKAKENIVEQEAENRRRIVDQETKVILQQKQELVELKRKITEENKVALENHRLKLQGTIATDKIIQSFLKRSKNRIRKTAE